MKFKFDMSVTVEAKSLEDALGAICSHISTVNRQMASGLKDLAPEFIIAEIDAKTEAVDLTDKVTQSRGPIPLDLDPKSAAGIALVEQQKVRDAEAARTAAALANAGRSDAEILAEHSAAEQAALNAPQS